MVPMIEQNIIQCTQVVMYESLATTMYIPELGVVLDVLSFVVVR